MRTWQEKQLRSRNDAAKGEPLDDLLPESFAVMREASRRVLGERHFDVQLLGGIVLHQGKIAEMRTGEGKTLTSTLPVYLNSMTGKGVHIVTVNDYLATRDSDWMGQAVPLSRHDGRTYCAWHGRCGAERGVSGRCDLRHE